MTQMGPKELISVLRSKGIRSQRVLDVLAEVKREEFVLPEDSASAYEDRPLSIGHDQTISQPWIVAHMTEWSDLKPTDRVLEIGTGCGYQTAILARLANQVFTVERIAELQAPAIERLKKLGFENIQFLTGDGYKGWPAHAPYDVIIVTAAPPDIPEALKSQLSEGGRLVIPVGFQGEQRLMKITKRNKAFHSENGVAVKFVPLVP